MYVRTYMGMVFRIILRTKACSAINEVAKCKEITFGGICKVAAFCLWLVLNWRRRVSEIYLICLALLSFFGDLEHNVTIFTLIISTFYWVGEILKVKSSTPVTRVWTNPDPPSPAPIPGMARTRNFKRCPDCLHRGRSTVTEPWPPRRRFHLIISDLIGGGGECTPAGLVDRTAACPPPPPRGGPDPYRLSR